MNKDEYNMENKEDNNITFSIIKTAINNIFIKKEEIKNVNEQNNSVNKNKIIIEDIDLLLKYVKNFDNLYKNISKENSKLYNGFKRNYRYIKNLSLNKQNKIFKELKLNRLDLLIAAVIIYLKNSINEKKHEQIKKILLIIIRLTAENIIPFNFFITITEVFIKILLTILNTNKDIKYSLNNEPFIFINDIIESLVIYPNEIKIENTNNYLLTDIIDIFDKYLITPNYLNINFRETSIWLKFLENHMINPLKEDDNIVDNDDDNDDDNENDNNNNLNNNNNNNDNIKENIQKKIYSFLTKIYKFNMRDDYFQNNIMKKGIINLKYSINSLNYLIHLFNEEVKLQTDSSFKIINGFSLKKDSFLFLPNIKLKLSEFSIIFSFNITQFPKDNENITILNIYNTSNKPLLNVSIDKNNYLVIVYNIDKKWNTFVKIKENNYYLICISLVKKLIIGSAKLCLFINEAVNQEIVKDEKNKGTKIEDTDLYYYKKKINSLELSKELFLELGKNNFVGIIGELLIINKSFSKKNIHFLFNLKDNYSKTLSQIYNKYDKLYSYDSINKSKYGRNKLSQSEKNSINFFKQFGFEIKLEIMIYKINRFTKTKYFSQDFYYQELLNNSIKPINIKENNERNLSLISICQIKPCSLNNSNNYSNMNNNSLSNSSFNNNSYIYQKDIYTEEKIDINLNLFKLRYSFIIFYQNDGIDYLTLQLYNIISTIEDQKLLDTYLYEIINFIYKIMLIMDEDLIDASNKHFPKLDTKISIFFLTLLTLLNKKKDNFTLNNNIILKLLKILDFFRYNYLFIQRNMILSILLEVKFYQIKSDIMKYPQILKNINSDLKDESLKDTSLINNEILYKILLLDFIFELKEYKHKSLMKLISTFIGFNNYKKSENNDIDEHITNEFINYFLGLKNEIKIYHYLKIIYLNLNQIKVKLLKNEKFLENINIRMERINSNHCKYCAYNQILWYLIYEEICIKSSAENDNIFNYNPIGFMKKPNIYFIKCIFAQCFSISNENKLKFIKSKEGIQFIISLIKNKNNKKNDSKTLDNKLTELVGYNKFIPRFQSIVTYIKFLYEEQIGSKDNNLLNVIEDSVDFIMSFFKEICIERKNNLNISKDFLRKKWSIIEYNINMNNILNDTEKKSKENRLKIQYNEFIKELLCCKGMKMFYFIYLNINYKNAIENIKSFILISIKEIYNPFYFYFLLPSLNFENDINKQYINNNEDENINQYIKYEILNLLGTELSKDKIIFDEDQDIALIQNNILLLIYIYQNLISKKLQINIEIEKIVILFLNFLLDNYFINSKYVFEVNDILNKEQTDFQNKKFIIEIIADILFILYDKMNYDLKYKYLIRKIFIDKKFNLKQIDEQYFLDSKSKGLCFKYFNQNYLHSICKGEEVEEILYTIYFLYYFCDKLNKYQNKNPENKDNSQPINLVKEILSSLFIDAIDLYNTYFQKIIRVRKFLINYYPYKIYKHFMLFIEDKYKEKSLTLDQLFKHYDKLIARKDIHFERNTFVLNEELLFGNTDFDINININYKNAMLETNTWRPRRKGFKIGSKDLRKMDKNFIKNKFKTKDFDNLKIINITNKLLKIKRSKSLFSYRARINYSSVYHKVKSAKNLDQLINKMLLNDSNVDINKSDSKNYKTKKVNDNIIIVNNANDSEKEEENNTNNTSKAETYIKNSSKDVLKKISYESIEREKDKKLDNNLSLKKNLKKDNISDMSEEENIIEEYDIEKKLKNMNIPSKFYRYIFHLSDPKTLKIFFNPKEYYIWNKFTIILKDMIFNNKKFDLMTKIYKCKYQKLSKFENNYILKYPSKLKNYICDDYYRLFLKPDINFFKHKLLSKSHPYLNKNIYNVNVSDEDNLSKIKFDRILPINYDLNPTKKINCELINNNGSLFGHIYFSHAFLLFISDSTSDPRSDKKSSIINEKQEEFYLYSYFLEERLKTKKKYIIMYFCEIKEIFIRRFCLNYIGYEIFMKDNRAHLFNFFNKNNLKKFLKIMSEKLELLYKIQNPNNVPIYSHSDNILAFQALNYNINNEVNFNVINDPIYIFEKNGFKTRFQKGDINNFKYLLLINKYASRTYNDNSQYLVFPLLFMDLKKKLKRDLSKAICLNKENNEISIDNVKENYNSFGNHFNTHYSNAGYILYYLVRLNPFTFTHIKFQSGHFDSPERLFSSLNNYLEALNNSEENRELCPELFIFYEAFINLNHNSLGYINSDKLLINDFISNDDNGIFEFIINMRQMLEKSNIIPWINNVFGYNQLSESEDLYNIFPLSSYEQKNNFEAKKKKLEKEGKTRKQIINDIKLDISLLSMGITPVQLFKTNHPLKNTTSKRLYSFFDGSFNNNNYNDKIVKSLAYKNLSNFINSNMINKYQIFCLYNENNNYGMKLIIKSKKMLYILKMYNIDNNNKNTSVIKLDLWKKKQIKIDPLSKICCELYPGIFCICRYIDNVIHIKSEKQSFLYQYKCIITSVEFFSHNEIKNNINNNSIHTNEILFGDEMGNLNLLLVEYEINAKKQTFQINPDKFKIIKKIKAHNGFIQGIIYVKRLNIIISYSEECQITINNAFSFNVINIIELGEDYYIKDIKISDYDLIYIYCFNNINNEELINCYTLNGVKITSLKRDKKINNFFVSEELIVVYENNLIELLYLYDLSNKGFFINPDDKDDKKDNTKESNIVFCDFITKDMKMIIIYQNNNIIIQDIYR